MKDNGSRKIDRLFESLSDKGPGYELSSAMRESIIGRLKPTLAPVKRLPSQAVLTAQFLAVCIAIAAAIVTITGSTGLRLISGTQVAWMVAIVAFGAVLFSVSLASRMVPASRRIPLAVVFAVPGLSLFGGIGLLFPAHQSQSFVSEGIVCAITEVATAVPAVVLFWLLTHRGAAFMGGRLGAVVSGLAVCLGLFVVQAHCMYPDAEHLLVWHGGIAVVLVVAGAIGGSAWRATSHRRPLQF